VYCDIWYIFLIPQFFEIPDDGYSPKVQFVQNMTVLLVLSLDKSSLEITDAFDSLCIVVQVK
jgi:hypothetical protein